MVWSESGDYSKLFWTLTQILSWPCDVSTVLRWTSSASVSLAIVHLLQEAQHADLPVSTRLGSISLPSLRKSIGRQTISVIKTIISWRVYFSLIYNFGVRAKLLHLCAANVYFAFLAPIIVLIRLFGAKAGHTV